MPYEISELDRQHANILEQVSVMCRSNHNGFTDETRLQVIKNLTLGTPYNEIYASNYSRIYGRVSIEELPDACILVSTHSDTVSNIENCYSILEEETGFYRGTFDNASTNAAAVISMREEDLPANIVFAFTGDEETGGCQGAKEAAAALIKAGKHPFCIALDVTYEGYEDNFLISVENLVPAPDAFSEKKALKQIGKLLMDLEPKNTQTFQLIKKGPLHVPENLPASYVSRSCGMVDEAFAYASMGCPTMSLCLPCGDGGMHSQSGVKVKVPVFEGYLLSLSSILYKMSDYAKNILYGKNNQVTEHHTERLSAYKIARENLISMAAQIEFPRRVYQPEKLTGWSSKFQNIDDDFEEDAYDEENFEIDNSLLEEYQFRNEDIQELVEEAEYFGYKSTFLAYATVPKGIYEVLGIDPKGILSEEEEELIDVLKEKIWDAYENIQAQTMGYLQESDGELDDSYWKYIRSSKDDYDDNFDDWNYDEQ